MFYVKGNAFLSSLTSTGTTLMHASVMRRREDRQQLGDNEYSISDRINPAIVVKKSLDFFPVCFFAAVALTLIPILCSVMVTPKLLETTIGTLKNDGLGDSGAPGANFNVPLAINCPHLHPRKTPARSVRDLRPDDIRVVAGLGDSVMAGFAAKGIQNNRFLSLDSLKEYRGVSFAMGGDVGATTLPNLIRFYTPHVYGASVGEQFFTFCYGQDFCPDFQYRSSIDYLNAAQSGAQSSNLDHELDYLLKQLEDAYDENLIQPSDWKLLTIFIGSNDVCHSCDTLSKQPTSFASNIQKALERIRLNVRNVLVQIVGILPVDQIFMRTEAYPEYCRPFSQSTFVLHDYECMCAHTEANRTIMSQFMPQYNSALQTIVRNTVVNDTFAVVFQPLNADINTVPIQAISDIDCFHPSELTHIWLAKELWRMLFLPSNQKQKSLKFDPNLSIYCPKDSDRFSLE